MINILKRNIEETIILKPGVSIEQIKNDVSLQLYYYLIEKDGFGTENITRALRNTLKFDPKTRETIFMSLCSEYLTYIEKNNSLTNRDDIYLKNILLSSQGRYNQLVDEVLGNARIIQRMCESDIENIVAEIKGRQRIDSSYMQKTARENPINTNVVNTLAGAQGMYNNLKKYSGYDYAKEFGYSEAAFGDRNGNPIENELMYGPNAKRKNAIYEVGNMTGILNIGQKNNGQYKEKQEDSILLYEHPENKEFKIAVVADGMGGGGKGDNASYIATKMTMEWFKTLPREYFDNDTLTYRNQYGQIQSIGFHQMITEHLARINDEIVRQLGNGPGTTFSAAITRRMNGKDKIDSVSIGDSKILKIGNDGTVIQLVKDDNVLYEGIENNSLYVLDEDRNTIYSSNPKFAFNGNGQISTIPYRPLNRINDNVHFLREEDMRFYRANNVIRECLGDGRSGESLKEKIYKNPNDFFSEHEFKPGEKILLCSDGMGDNLTKEEFGEVFYNTKNARECLKEVINKIYELQHQKLMEGTNRPNSYIENNSEFNKFLKGSSDNISGVIIYNKGEER